jgi:hypothetical protein
VNTFEWSPIVNMPTNPTNGKPILKLGSGVANVFSKCMKPTRLSELRKLFSSAVAHYPLSIHVSTAAGRQGVMWDVLVNSTDLRSERYGNALTEQEVLHTLPADTLVQVVNAAESGLLVNSKHRRSHPLQL